MDTLKLTIDVETIPTQNKAFIDGITVKCPGNISKADSIKKWEETVKPGLIDNAYRKTSLDSTKGELIVIGWAINDEPSQSVYRDYRDPEQTEYSLLQGFYDAVYTQLTAGFHSQVLWIGHYILGFDLPFIRHRSIINKCKSSLRIPYNAKPWAENIFDTKAQWKAASSASSSLIDICQAIGIPAKQDMHGSEVWDYAQRGEIVRIADYCRSDVDATRELYKVMR